MKNRPCPIEDRHASMFGPHCVVCSRKIGPTYKEKLDARVEAVPQEVKQKLIDCLHAGKTVGESMKIAGIEETVVAGAIITRSIGTIHFLRSEVDF